jgi:hypothetical protein
LTNNFCLIIQLVAVPFGLVELSAVASGSIVVVFTVNIAVVLVADLVVVVVAVADPVLAVPVVAAVVAVEEDLRFGRLGHLVVEGLAVAVGVVGLLTLIRN